MRHYVKASLAALTAVFALLCCGCSAEQGAPDTETLDDPEDFVITSEDTADTAEGYAEVPETAAPEREPGGTETGYGAAADNWLMEGFEVPDNWIEVMTAEEALARFDELTGGSQDGESIEDIILTLMNRNILAFETMQCRTYNAIGTPEGYTPSDDPQIYPIVSDYFDSVDDITELFHMTYTDSLAEYLLYGSPERPMRRFYDADGVMSADIRYGGTWTTQPFMYKSYIEPLKGNDYRYRFIWHYITWGPWDYVGYMEGIDEEDPYEWYPRHDKMTFSVIREDGEWRLTSTVFDNPELGECDF